jgi:DNA-binding NarL/FixJ family response regulator
VDTGHVSSHHSQAEVISSPAVIVGRDGEIELLRSALAEALDGHGRLVLISGEPGIGKSTLAEAVTVEAAIRGMRASAIRVPETVGVPPYWVWTELLRRTVRSAVLESEVARTSRWRILGRILPELTVSDGEPPLVAAEANDVERFRLADEVASVILDAARVSGVVIVIDDLHAADASSIEVLAHIAGRVGASRLLIIAAHRDALGDVSPALQLMLAQVSRQRSTLRIPLTAFDVTAVRTQLAAIIGRDIGSALATSVHARTGGNPFFTAEVARLIQWGDVGAGAASAVPRSVRDVIGSRLQRLPKETRDVIDRAALAGIDVPIDVLAAACDRESAHVLASLEPAVRAGLMRQDALPSRIAFVHMIVAETIVESLSLSRAAELHACIARAIEITRANTLEDWLPSLARHWSAASSSVRSSQRALEVAQLAAEQAEKRLAFGDALALWHIALQAADPARATPATRAEVRLRVARSLFMTGQVASALDACLTAAAEAETAGRPDLAAAAALVVEGVSEPRWAALLIGLAESALRKLSPGELALRARLHAHIGQLLHFVVSDPAEREVRETARALQLAEDSGDRQALQAAVRAHQVVISGPDGAEERLTNAERMIRLGEDAGDSWPAFWGHLWSVDAFVQLGRLHDAEAEVERMAPIVERLRWPVARWHLLRSRAAILQARGRFDQALDAAHRAAEEVSQSGLERATWLHAAFLQGHAECVGRVAGDDESRHRLLEAAANDAGALLWAAAVMVRDGELEEARALHARMPPPDRWIAPRYVLMTSLKMRLQIALGLEVRDEVEQLRARMLPVARWHVTPGSGTFITFGSGFLYTGMAAAFLGDLNSSIEEMRHAVEDNSRCGAITMSVVARQQLAEVLVQRRTGTDLDQARRLSSSVLEDAQRLGMLPFIARASALLRSLPRRRLKSEDLTEREREVARLVADGLTNRQIAVRLGISERTVENHLDHIFDKLGFASRAQVAAWVASSRP